VPCITGCSLVAEETAGLESCVLANAKCADYCDDVVTDIEAGATRAHEVRPLPMDPRIRVARALFEARHNVR
jgi:hypothetical protein